MPITGNQVKAARALAGLEQIDLAERAGVSANTIRNMEARGAEVIRVRLDTIDAVRGALRAAGVILLEDGQLSNDGIGVRLIKGN